MHPVANSVIIITLLLPGCAHTCGRRAHCDAIRHWHECVCWVLKNAWERRKKHAPTLLIMWNTPLVTSRDETDCVCERENKQIMRETKQTCSRLARCVPEIHASSAALHAHIARCVWDHHEFRAHKRILLYVLWYPAKFSDCKQTNASARNAL
jgi:hypothetical protein